MNVSRHILILGTFIFIYFLTSISGRREYSLLAEYYSLRPEILVGGMDVSDVF